MNHRIGLTMLLFFGLLAGCAHQQTRLQSDEEPEREKEVEIKTIGDVTSVANAEPIAVMGVGLVVGLDGTGGGAPPGAYRTMLEDQLRKREDQLRKMGIDSIKQLLGSPNVSLVLVSGQIPAGARKGDKIDLEVATPPQSKTTSLRGGYLLDCHLFNYESTKRLDPDSSGPDRSLMGHPVATAEGALLVGLGDGDEGAKLKQGRIWNGGKTRIDRPFYLVLNSDQQYARLAQAVSDRINERFHGSTAGGLNNMADAKSKSVVFLRVPPQYQHNLPRFLRVIRLIPLRDQLKELQQDRLGGVNGTLSVGAGSPYRRRMQEDLLDPKKTITAALRLEALGDDSMPALKKGLTNDHVLIRFASAEALAYLGSPSCGEELARLVEQQPALRSYSLTALASLDEAVSHVKLRDLLGSGSAESRYGAFRALRALDEREPAIAGEQFNDSWWLHRVAPHAPALAHMSSSRRPEIVLFGENPSLKAPLSLLTGEFTVTAAENDPRCTICRFSTRHGTSRKQCSLELYDVLRTMAELGAQYPDVVELLRQADLTRTATCRIAVDALPQATDIYELARSSTDDPELLRTDISVLEGKADFGATPNLFEKSRKKKSAEESGGE